MTRTPTVTRFSIVLLLSFLLAALPFGADAFSEEKQVEYVVQFWSERSDYDESSANSIGGKYEYLGLKVFEGNEGEVPNILAVSPSNIQFPDIALEDSSDTEKFSKLFHVNTEFTNKQNAGDAGNVRPLTTRTGNVYNIFFDREVYEVVFEKSNTSESFDPVVTKGGVAYDATTNPYILRMRFGQVFGDAWPYDQDISNLPASTSSRFGLTGWKIMTAETTSTYLDTPPYRLTYDEFIQYAGKKTTSVSRPDVSYSDHTIAMGISWNTFAHPVHVDFALEGFEDGAAAADYPIDGARYYWKSDTYAQSYSFPVPELKGFKRVIAGKKQRMIRGQADLDKINAKRGDAEPIVFVNTLYGTRRNTNGYLRFEYNRLKFKLFIDEDPRVPKEDGDYSAADTRILPYDFPIDKVELPTPTKPTDLPDEYMFRGWAWDPNGVSFISESSGTMPNHNVVLHAIWEIPSDVTFNLDGGIVAGSTDTITRKQFNGETVEFPTPTKDVNTFLGWVDDYDTDVTYQSSDTPTVIGSMSFTAKWDGYPALEVKDETVTEGDEFDLMSLVVSATDEEDGSLAGQVKLVDDGGFDATKPGTYTVTFEVKDSAGAKVTKTATVKVLMRAPVINAVPTLKVQDATITEGDEFDLMSLVVSATDEEDGSLAGQVKLVDDGGFDATKPGTYTVTFEVKDSAGAKVTKTATVVVNERETVKPPAGNASGQGTGSQQNVNGGLARTGIDVMGACGIAGAFILAGVVLTVRRRNA